MSSSTNDKGAYAPVDQGPSQPATPPSQPDRDGPSPAYEPGRMTPSNENDIQASGRVLSGVVLPEPTRCQRDEEDGPCVVQADHCTCRVPFDCSEDEGGCCFCVHMDTYYPCPTFGFGCGPGCDCCTPYQQRQVFRQVNAPARTPSPDRTLTDRSDGSETPPNAPSDGAA